MNNHSQLYDIEKSPIVGGDWAESTGTFVSSHAANDRRVSGTRKEPYFQSVPAPSENCWVEHRVVWKASRWDGGKHHRLPATAAVEGRLIAARVGRGKSKQWLYLFTTLDWPAETILPLYSRRWNIETDLRSLKRTVRLHHMTVKSNDMLEKELYMAVCAYNLVRTVMCLAARQSDIDPRQLSFAMVLNVVQCAWHKLTAAPTPQEFDREFARVLDLARQCRLPNKRKSRRCYPRALWRRQPGFPFRKEEQN